MNQERAVPVIPREYWRREMRMEWLMVSQAALRSRRMRMVRRPESAERSRSLYQLTCWVMLTFSIRVN